MNRISLKARLCAAFALAAVSACQRRQRRSGPPGRPGRRLGQPVRRHRRRRRRQRPHLTVTNRSQLLAASPTAAPSQDHQGGRHHRHERRRAVHQHRRPGRARRHPPPGNTTLIGGAPTPASSTATSAVSNAVADHHPQPKIAESLRRRPVLGSDGRRDRQLELGLRRHRASRGVGPCLDRPQQLHRRAGHGRPVCRSKTAILKQCHDGALDITKASDFVTVSYNLFAQHHKNILIGSSDSATATTASCASRSATTCPRHRASARRACASARCTCSTTTMWARERLPVYPNSYSVGVGANAKILSNNNVFAIAGAAGATQVVTNPGGTAGALQGPARC